MTLNQGLFLGYIKSIVGVLSFRKRFEGKNYVSTFNWDVSSIYFFFIESIRSSTRAFSWDDKCFSRQMQDWVVSLFTFLIALYAVKILDIFTQEIFDLNRVSFA